MATVTLYPVANQAAGSPFNGSFSNPDNAHVADGTTSAASPGKNQEYATVWQVPFDATAIPDGSTINGVTVEISWRVSTSTSVATLRSTLFTDAAQLNALSAVPGYDDSSEPTTLVTRSYAASTLPTLADLRAGLWVRGQMMRGNSNTSVAGGIDFIRVTVDYTAAVAQQFQQALAATSTFTPAIGQQRSFLRTLAVASTFAVGLVASRVFLKALSVASTFVPGLNETYVAGRALAVSSAMSVGLNKRVNKLLAVTSPMTIAMQRRIFLTLAVSSAFGVEMRRFIGKTLAVSSGFSAGLAEGYRTTRTLSVSGVAWTAGVATHFVAAGGTVVRRLMMLLGVGR